MQSDRSISDRQTRFQAIVDAHYASLWSYVSFLTRGAAEAEDITHQAFLLLFDRLATERTVDDPGPWLRGVVRNLVRDWWRQKKRLPLDLAEHLSRLAEQADDAVSAAIQEERESALSRCLEKLSSEDREIVKARYEDGLRVTQIAERDEANEATTRVRLFRIRERLKTCVEMTLMQGSTS